MDKLGIEPSLLIAQIVNFIIIIIVLGKLLYKPILTTLEKRRKEIEEGLSLTQKMRVEEEKVKEKREKLLEQARVEAQAIIVEAKKQAKEKEKAILEEAGREAKEIIVKGKAEVDRLKESMAKDLRTHAIELSVAMAKRLLGSALKEKDKQEILEKHLKELETLHYS